MRWYVVATKTAREGLAQRHLANQNFETFLPLRYKSVGRGKQIRTRKEPLFPGYLFIRMDKENVRWRAINGTIGVKYLLTRGEQPVPLPDGFTEMLFENLSEDGTVQFFHALKLGTRVEMVAGPFARHIGKLIELDGRGRAGVLLELLSMQVPVRTTVSSLLPA